MIYEISVYVFFIPHYSEDGSETVNHRLARGRSVFHMAIPQSVRNLSAALLEEDSDDEDEDEGWQPVSRRNLMTDPSVLQPQGMARPEYTQVSEVSTIHLFSGDTIVSHFPHTVLLFCSPFQFSCTACRS